MQTNSICPRNQFIKLEQRRSVFYLGLIPLHGFSNTSTSRETNDPAGTIPQKTALLSQAAAERGLFNQGHKEGVASQKQDVSRPRPHQMIGHPSYLSL